MALYPSLDFKLFDVPSFSPLEANEYGAMTSFSANTPTKYLDFALNQLFGLTQSSNARPYRQVQFPAESELSNLLSFFQGGASETRERLKRVRDEADEMYRKAGGSDAVPAAQDQGKPAPAKKRGCTLWDVLNLNCTPAWMTESGSAEPSDSAVMKSGVSAGVNTDVGALFRNLPAGAGVFLIAVVVIILLILFARK